MRDMTFPLILVLTLALLMSGSSYIRANESRLCKPVTSHGEGHWPIDEKSFTQAEAMKALEKLSTHVNEVDPRVDFVAIENDLLLVKGYLLKAYALHSDDDVEYFCEFIQTEAYVRH